MQTTGLRWRGLARFSQYVPTQALNKLTCLSYFVNETRGKTYRVS